MSPSAGTIWQSYSSNNVFIFLKLLNNYLIWIYNYVIYGKTLSLSFQKWAVEYNTAELWHSPKCSRYIFSSKNLLTLLSFWSVLTKRTLKNCQFFNLKQRTLFSPPTNSKGTKKYKSYTRNSFRPGHRADLHLEHRNGDTELALCSASRSDSINCICLSTLLTALLVISLSPGQTGPFTCQHLLHSEHFEVVNTDIRWTDLFFFSLLFVVFSHLASALQETSWKSLLLANYTTEVFFLHDKISLKSGLPPSKQGFFSIQTEISAEWHY